VPGIRRRALIDLDAFAANLAERRTDEWLDLCADAYGHGLDLLAPVARDSGVAGLVVRDESEAATARRAGFPEAAIEIGAWRGNPRGTELGAIRGGRPVMTLVAEVIAVKRVEAGAGVSYGYSFRSTAPTTLALVGLGYADGVPRLASNTATVLVGSGIHRIAGRVAMDQFVVDCGDDAPEVGSDAVLFGDPDRGEPSVEEWSGATSRETLDVTAGIGYRVERVRR
jgi:alanine racemase